mgnify:CR=1 FL=1
MEDEVRKHIRGIRILVTLALLAACISFAFSYVLFKEVNIPLERLRTQELNLLEGKVDYLMTSRLDGRLDVELQAALLAMRDVAAQTSGDTSTTNELLDQRDQLVGEINKLVTVTVVVVGSTYV